MQCLAAAVAGAAQAAAQAVSTDRLAATTTTNVIAARIMDTTESDDQPKVAVKVYPLAFATALRVQRCTNTSFANAICATPPLSPQSQASVHISLTESAGNLGGAELALGPFELASLPEETYLMAALHLDAHALCEVDATCRILRVLNQSCFGPWHALGARTFRGIELEKSGIYDEADATESKTLVDSETQHTYMKGTTYCVHLGLGGVNKLARLDWKERYWHFLQRLPTFQLPFIGQEIRQVQNADEVAYCSSILRADLLGKGSGIGVYIEFEIVANADNLSLALVDFEAGGHSSITFSPDTGAIIRERKVREVPRKVEGAYIQPLAATLPNRRFEGSVSLYLYSGHLAFLRRRANDAAEQEANLWESTGFVTDLSWAEGRCLTPCLAFRDEGPYHVKIVKVESAPPIPLGSTPKIYDETRWSSLDWEAEGLET